MRILLILAILSTVLRADVPGSSEDEAAIRKLEAGWQAGWNSHDMKALTVLLSDDIDFVSVAGTWLTGKDAFEKHHARYHAMQFKDSVWTTSNVKVAFLKPDVALVDVQWTLKGDRDPDGTPRQPRSGIFTRVVTKDGGRWLIRASHNVNIRLPGR
jgi:uncharacterized protein (TIGR02246 family)